MVSGDPAMMYLISSTNSFDGFERGIQGVITVDRRKESKEHMASDGGAYCSTVGNAFSYNG